MKNKWLYISCCFIAPHIMFIAGVFFLSKKDLEHKTFGLKLCQWSTMALIISSVVYYIFFIPIISPD
jgi:multisubunit Na+/H+ antiporter MnhC subunit